MRQVRLPLDALDISIKVYAGRTHSVFLGFEEVGRLPIGYGTIVDENNKAFIDIEFDRDQDRRLRVTGCSYDSVGDVYYLRNIHVGIP